ncbi:MAG: hypothetical protein KDH84_14600, partial [Calditrichaeota bacterium]|nr:hypothetical protein [Calditrichota bacterium]
KAHLHAQQTTADADFDFGLRLGILHFDLVRLVLLMAHRLRRFDRFSQIFLMHCYFATLLNYYIIIFFLAVTISPAYSFNNVTV